MMHKFNPENRNHLDDPERRAILDPARILSAVGIEKGSTIIEPGCGTGYFTAPLAAQTGIAGKVYACDINPDLLKITAQRVTDALLDNVTIFPSQESHFPLPDRMGDLVFLANVLHETEDKKAFLLECTRVLKPHGRIAVVEWEKKTPPPGPPVEERWGKDQTSTLLTQLGLSPHEPKAVGPHHYLVIAQRRQ